MAADRRNGIWVLVVVTLVLVAAALTVGTVARARDPARGPQVLVIGDSVTFMSSDAIIEAFDWTSNVNPQGRPGFRTDELVPLARQLVEEEDPNVLVVLTGYNDLIQGVDTSAAVREMMEIAAGVPCAVWVLLPTKATYAPEAARAFNQRVIDLAATRPTVHIATGWRDAVDAQPGPDPDMTLVSEDEIHPNEAGLARLAQVMEEAVSRDCR